MSVSLHKLTIQFAALAILDGLDAEFKQGHISVIKGPSGAGKSTLMAAIAGYVIPTSGQIDRHGASVEDVAFIHQATSLLPKRSALDNVAVGGLSKGLSYPAARLEATNLLARLGMLDLARRQSRLLSGGERQRIAILRMVARGAPILLADEPTAALDPGSRELVCQSLRVAADEGATVIVATHDPYVADRSDSVLELWKER